MLISAICLKNTPLYEVPVLTSTARLTQSVALVIRYGLVSVPVPPPKDCPQTGLSIANSPINIKYNIFFIVSYIRFD